MAEYKEVALANLLLDTRNPRLDEEMPDQRAALQAIMEVQGAKLVELADDIAANGLSPLDGFLVMPVAGTKDDFVVLEGNRRITALKLLANPRLAEDILSKAQVSKLDQLSKGGSTTNERKMLCAVVKSRDEATHWLRLRHGGALDGVGLVKWGAKENARFEERRTGKKDAYLGLLSYLVAEGAITEDVAGAIKYTNLERVLNDAHVRERLGVEVDKAQGVVSTHYPKDDAVKGLGAFARKLATSTVYDIDKAKERKTFVDAIKADLPDPKTRMKTAQPLGTPNGRGSNGSGGVSGGVGGKKRKAVRESKTVAPANPALVIKQKRINSIYAELRRLRTENHTNSGAVMMRVFLELSVDDYMDVKSVPKPKAPKGKDPTLRSKLLAVADHLEATGAMTKAQLKPIRTVGGGDKWLATSIDSLHAYVHNKDFHPSPGDVRAVWDTLEPLFVHIWQ